MPISRQVHSTLRTLIEEARPRMRSMLVIFLPMPSVIAQTVIGRNFIRHSGSRAAAVRNPFLQALLRPDGFRVQPCRLPRNDEEGPITPRAANHRRARGR